MKRLIPITMLLIAATVHAEQWLEMDNRVGGKIVLTADRCPDYPSLRRMYASAPNSPTAFGCWGWMANEIHVVYDDGKAYTYPMKDFRYMSTEAEK